MWFDWRMSWKPVGGFHDQPKPKCWFTNKNTDEKGLYVRKIKARLPPGANLVVY